MDDGRLQTLDFITMPEDAETKAFSSGILKKYIKYSENKRRNRYEFEIRDRVWNICI